MGMFQLTSFHSCHLKEIDKSHRRPQSGQCHEIPRERDSAYIVHLIEFEDTSAQAIMVTQIPPSVYYVYDVGLNGQWRKIPNFPFISNRGRKVLSKFNHRGWLVTIDEREALSNALMWFEVISKRISTKKVLGTLLRDGHSTAIWARKVFAALDFASAGEVSYWIPALNGVPSEGG